MKEIVVIGAIAAVGAVAVFLVRRSSADGDNGGGGGSGGSRRVLGVQEIVTNQNDPFADIESLSRLTGGNDAPLTYQDTYRPGLKGIEDGLPIYDSTDDIPEGTTGVLKTAIKGQDAPVLVEKYRGMDLMSPVAITPVVPITPEREAASREVARQLVDTIKASGLDTKDPADLKVIGQIDNHIRLTEYSKAGIAWEDSHMDITDLGQKVGGQGAAKNETWNVVTDRTRERATRWLDEIKSFQAQGGKVDPSTITKLQSVASGETTILKKN